MFIAVQPPELRWFASEVIGKPERSFLSGGEPRGTDPRGIVRVLGTLRLGLPHRDVDLFTIGEEADTVWGGGGVEGVVFETMTFTSPNGTVRTLQKLKGKTFEGRTVTLTANPAAWWRDQDREYAVATAILRAGGPMAAEYHRLRAEGRKMEAYHLLGVKMSGERY